MPSQRQGPPNEFKTLPRIKVFETVALVLVPSRVLVESANLPTGKIRYLRYAHSVKGGNVYVHVHADEPDQFKGRQITARCELWKRTNADGTQDLYIDLYPVTETTARHRLCVTNGEVPRRYAFSRQFSVPAPKQGQVIFVPMR